MSEYIADIEFIVGLRLNKWTAEGFNIYEIKTQAFNTDTKNLEDYYKCMMFIVDDAKEIFDVYVDNKFYENEFILVNNSFYKIENYNSLITLDGKEIIDSFIDGFYIWYRDNGGINEKIIIPSTYDYVVYTNKGRIVKDLYNNITFITIELVLKHTEIFKDVNKTLKNKINQPITRINNYIDDLLNINKFENLYNILTLNSKYHKNIDIILKQKGDILFEVNINNVCDEYKDHFVKIIKYIRFLKSIKNL